MEEHEIAAAEEMKKILANKNLSQIKDYFAEQCSVELNIAVTGESGSGKSSFVNAFRGLGDEDEGSAETGVVETTNVPTAYPYTKYPNVKMWDLPGIGTPNFKADEYLEQVEFKRYDFFIIIASDRFRECHAQLAAEIVKMEKTFYFVRSKIDCNISAEKRKKTFNKEKTLDRIRKDCIEGLEKIGIDSPVVFLISCFNLALYDFNQLEEKLERDLPQYKRNVLLLALPNITLEINERKRALLENVWKSALFSACAVIIPVPYGDSSLSFSIDFVILVSEFTKYYYAFSLDASSLQRLSDTSWKSVDELKSVLKSPLHKGITQELIIELLHHNSFFAVEKSKHWLSFIPFLGSLVAAPLSFVTVYLTLRRCLDELVDDAYNVLTFALQTTV
ncbi:interferon-inducible GTPase 5-like [Hoplias malabaricus]|uniref:interferon-inducible GTPase 5-like n=1 Tax=Hoplias malabaricus TaxID=27720 RepID=UPI003461F9E4